MGLCGCQEVVRLREGMLMRRKNKYAQVVNEGIQEKVSTEGRTEND